MIEMHISNNILSTHVHVLSLVCIGSYMYNCTFLHTHVFDVFKSKRTLFSLKVSGSRF